MPITFLLAAVFVGMVVLTLLSLSLYFLLREIRESRRKAWMFCGIVFAVAVSGIVLFVFLGGMHLHDEVHSRRIQALNITRNIVLGVLNFEGTHKFGPSGTILSDGRFGHSWMTQLLPYLEELALFQQIKLDKPWTDPENHAVFETRIRLFESIMVPQDELRNADGYALSFYAVNERLLPVGERVSFDSITDGTNNTILLGEVKENVRA